MIPTTGRTCAGWVLLMLCVHLSLATSFSHPVSSQQKRRNTSLNLNLSRVRPNLARTQLQQHLRCTRLGFPFQSLRGGASAVKAASSESSSTSPRPRKRKILLWSISFLTLSYLIYDHRTALRTVLNKEHIQATVLNLLHRVEQEGSHGILLYMLGMAVWELFGLTTIPVETAAGMAFGWKRGFLASAMGKLLGCLGAYWLGRSVLHDMVREKLSQNKVMNLIDGHVAANPLRTAFLMRYSIFPELVKNCGASLFVPLKPWMFVVSVLGHGCIYSAVWTYLGVDTAHRLEHPHLPANHLVQASVLAATIVGMIITPLLMAWWIRDMQESELNTLEPEDK